MTSAITRAFALTAALGLAAVALSGCQDAKRALGYEKSAPDEFQVVERAPLAMPPDFTLRPPAPGALRPQEGSTRDQARQALLGNRGGTAIPTQGRTPGDMVILQKAGADRIQADIRTLVNKETQALAEADKTFTDKLVFWRKPEPYGQPVDPVKESQRLRENQALGKSVTEGETPVIKRRKKGMLEGVFD